MLGKLKLLYVLCGVVFLVSFCEAEKEEIKEETLYTCKGEYYGEYQKAPKKGSNTKGYNKDKTGKKA